MELINPSTFFRALGGYNVPDKNISVTFAQFGENCLLCIKKLKGINKVISLISKVAKTLNPSEPNYLRHQMIGFIF